MVSELLARQVYALIMKTTVAVDCAVLGYHLASALLP
jgi:hypothetical protein